MLQYRIRTAAVAPLLVLVFVFGQSGVLLHDIAHLGDSAHTELTCHLCVAGDGQQPAAHAVASPHEPARQVADFSPVPAPVLQQLRLSSHRVRAPPHLA